MKKILKLRTLLVSTVLGISLMLGSAYAENAFTIAVLSDTQNYVDFKKPQPDSANIFIAQTQFLADHKDDLNLVFITW
jgi:hypothetical protein